MKDGIFPNSKQTIETTAHRILRELYEQRKPEDKGVNIHEINEDGSLGETIIRY